MEDKGAAGKPSAAQTFTSYLSLPLSPHLAPLSLIASSLPLIESRSSSWPSHSTYGTSIQYGSTTDSGRGYEGLAVQVQCGARV